MTEQQLRYRLRKQGYLLRKRNSGYMIVEATHNFAIAGGKGFGYTLTLEDVIEYAEILTA